MTNRVLSKLFPPHQSINILQFKKETTLPQLICSEQKCTCSFNSKNLQKNSSHNQYSNSLPTNTSLIRNCPMCSPYLCSRFIQLNLRNEHPDLNYLRKFNNLGIKLFDSKRALMHTGSNGKLTHCKYLIKKPLWNTKFVFSKKRYPGQIQPYTQKSELQPVVSEGIGWAGQPIVKRTHTILPEVNGDVSDVFTAMNQLQNSEICENNQNINNLTLTVESINPLQEQKIDLLQDKNSNPLQDQNSNPLQDQNSNLQQDQISDTIELNSSESSYQNSYPEFDNCYGQKTIESCIKSHDNISLMNSSNQLSNPSESVPMNPTELRQPVPNFVEHDLNRSKSNYFDVNELKEDIKPKIILKTTKSKLKKKTKIVGGKNVRGLSKVTMVRKKKSNVFGPSRKYKTQPQLVMCQRNKSLYYSSENVLLTENRQLMTDTTLCYPRISAALNSKKSKLTSDKNKGKTSKKTSIKKKEIPSDDCVCPETIEVKNKKTTKVCGEADGKGKKEKKERKKKMCIIEPIIKYRQKSFVCPSAAMKGKRKRDLPKCPEPEKKVATRTEVCPPQLDDEAKAAKECVKQVEVKIRKRSKVCKPVIIYAKEEASIKIEKTVCAESRVKQTFSKHTKVCTPSSNDKMKKSKRKGN